MSVDAWHGPIRITAGVWRAAKRGTLESVLGKIVEPAPYTGFAVSD